MATKGNDVVQSDSELKPSSSAAKRKKRVCFEADELLVKVFEFACDEDSEVMPEELEPCNPVELVEKVNGLSLKSVLATKYGSYSLLGESSPQNGESILSLCDSEDKTEKQKHQEDGEKDNKPPTKVKRRGRTKKARSMSADRDTSKSNVLGPEVDQSSTKVGIDSKTDASIPQQTKAKKEESRITRSRPQTKRDSNDRKTSRRERTSSSSGPNLKKSHSVDSHLAAASLGRPKSCSSLPALHLSPYRRTTKRDFPVSAKPITFPDFLSPRPDLGRSRSATRVESASWAKMSFISKDSSPPSDRRENFSGPSSKTYSWKVANGLIKPVDLTTPSIAPMWENLTSKPSTAETNSVLSAL